MPKRQPSRETTRRRLEIAAKAVAG
jgi:hypothetical protein